MNAAQPTRYPGKDAKSEIMQIMADGRERTTEDLRRRLPHVSDRAVTEGLQILSRMGLLRSSWELRDLPIYRAAKSPLRAETVQSTDEPKAPRALPKTEAEYAEAMMALARREGHVAAKAKPFDATSHRTYPDTLDRACKLIAQSPHGVTSGALGRLLDLSHERAKRIALDLFNAGRVTRKIEGSRRFRYFAQEAAE